MKEDNKYYVPSIEEFCIGFELEYKGDRIGSINNSGWRSLIIQDSKDMRFVIDAKPPERFRVKYLDSQDIIDCGFEFGEYSKGKFKNEIVELYNKFSNVYTIHAIGDDYRDKLFEGTIKNKHELQIILKMIGVL